MAYHNLFQTFDAVMSKFKDYMRSFAHLLLHSITNGREAEPLYSLYYAIYIVTRVQGRSLCLGAPLDKNLPLYM